MAYPCEFACGSFTRRDCENCKLLHGGTCPVRKNTLIREWSKKGGHSL